MSRVFPKWLITTLLYLQLINATAQQCGNCNRRPSVAIFDFDIQVPAPSANDTTHELWPEWKALYQLAGIVGSQLATQNAGCIKFNKPPSFDIGDTTLSSVGGETFTNLPSNPKIGALNLYGDYLLTGTIAGTGTSLSLQVELQASCSRKVVAKASTQFDMRGIVGNLSGIAGQIASQLSPLAQKINDFEKQQRTENKSLSIDYFNADPIKLTPAKKTLKKGETTPVTIELKDCDGTPLAGREIIFSETEFEGFRLQKTIGGVITPSRVTTDEQGKATVQFRLDANAERAIINAHSRGKSVRGCEDMFTGTVFLNIKTVYSGFVKYKYDNVTNCADKAASGCLEQQYKGTTNQGVEYTATFYQEGEKSENLDVSFTGKEEEDGTTVPNCMEAGSLVYRKFELRKHIIICVSAAQGQTSIQIIDQASSGGLIDGAVQIAISDTIAHLTIDMNFKTVTKTHVEQTILGSTDEISEERTSWNVAFDTMFDKGFKATKHKAGGRTKYTIDFTRSFNPGCNLNSKEEVKVVIWEE